MEIMHFRFVCIKKDSTHFHFVKSIQLRRVAVWSWQNGNMTDETDVRIGKNVKMFRGEMTMDILAAKMRLRGHRWSPATVAKVEGGTRQLRLNEACDLLECCGYSSYNLSELVQNHADASISFMRVRLENMLEDTREQLRLAICNHTILQRMHDGGWDFVMKDGEEPTAEARKELSEWIERFSEERIEKMGVQAAKEYADHKKNGVPYPALEEFFDSIDASDSAAEDAEE